ncbi:hypothetical protein BC936DRAFT_148045 [Jimgerdemannia flammicorona]|uniref:Uncharacterized protein n=1 Tax=Jimgerdemannia flammicorona TaxID=994334 RepID=A0A433D3Y4_9FUNG|nr:hypothetical protein BC936DRAFT_148045 [Jimgerdemannia flammicorona]
MFTVNSVEIRIVQLDAMKASEWNSDIPLEKAKIILRIVTAKLDVRVSSKIKKKPLKQTEFSPIFNEEQHHFQRPHRISGPRGVYIGFRASQTTGCASHMTARFIPTVERDLINFNGNYIAVWNTELLAI